MKSISSSQRPPPRVLLALPLVLFVGSLALLQFKANSDILNSNTQQQPLQLHQLSIRSLIAASHGGSSHHGGTPDNSTVSHDIPSYIPYHDLYSRLPPVLAIALLVLWLIFLFSFLGIVASDFFCPNLSTLAARLGLPEDVAGATMVGWANGAPDLFSTFASIKAGSGSLAIGELIGAASFICSVVAGSMVLVNPFKVGRFNFFRDVGFFTLAVAFTLIILRDGTIHAWESHCMVALYACYVVLVAGGSYWRRRRRRQKERDRLIREAWIEGPPLVIDDDGAGDESVGLVNGDRAGTPMSTRKERKAKKSIKDLRPLHVPDFRVTDDEGGTTDGERGENEPDDYFSAAAPGDRIVSSPAMTSLATPGSITRRRSATHGHLNRPSRGHHHSHSKSHAHAHYPLPSPIAGRILHRSSILGAIEFRDVVNSLQAESHAHRHLGAFASQEERDLEAATGLRVGGGPGNLNRSRSLGRVPGQHTPLSDRSRRKRADRSSSRRTDASSRRSSKDTKSSLAPHDEAGTGEVAASAPAATTQSLLGEELQVDDPWKNAPPPSSRSMTPDMSRSSIGSNDGWAVSPAQSATGAEESSPGDSDVTARPLPAQTGRRSEIVDVDEAVSNGDAMSRFPSKAQKILGIVPAKAAKLLGPSPSIPPKAQRVLGTTASSTLTSTPTPREPFDWKYLFAAVQAVGYSLFPSLHQFRHKSWLVKITSLISVPAVLVLNLTLPVVDESEAEAEFLDQIEKEQLENETEDGDVDDGSVDLSDGESDVSSASRSSSADSINDEMARQARSEHDRNALMATAIAHELHSPVATHHHPHSHHFSSQEESDVSGIDALLASGLQAAIPSLPELDRALEEERQKAKDSKIDTVGPMIVEQEDLTRYITAIQTLLAPVFVCLALLSDQLKWWHPLVALVIGASLSTTSVLFFRDERHITRVLTLCVIGFIVAIVWILSIVNEVVGVLQTLGHVFNLSDAILGLTIFAIGNSLGDLVANVTVARMGYPLMALSACFGGPMLNILLGIGLSGTYVTSITHRPVHIEMSNTLSLSGIALLVVLCSTLISVPLNGFILSRRWAVGIICVYAAVMTVNVIVEIRSE